MHSFSFIIYFDNLHTGDYNILHCTSLLYTLFVFGCEKKIYIVSRAIWWTIYIGQQAPLSRACIIGTVCIYIIFFFVLFVRCPRSEFIISDSSHFWTSWRWFSFCGARRSKREYIYNMYIVCIEAVNIYRVMIE